MEIQLDHIVHAIEQTPFPDSVDVNPLTHHPLLIAPLAEKLSELYPQLSLWSCTVLGYGLETLDKGRKKASQALLDNLATQEAECSHESLGVRLGDKILCEFGIVDEDQWGEECRQHLVQFIAKDNLRALHMDKPAYVPMQPSCRVQDDIKDWLTAVLVAVQANVLNETTPQSAQARSLPRL